MKPRTSLAALAAACLAWGAAHAQGTVNAICSTDQSWCELAAQQFEVAPEDIVFAGGRATIRGVPDRSSSFGEIMMAAGRRRGRICPCRRPGAGGGGGGARALGDGDVRAAGRGDGACRGVS